MLQPVIEGLVGSVQHFHSSPSDRQVGFLPSKNTTEKKTKVLPVIYYAYCLSYSKKIGFVNMNLFEKREDILALNRSPR